MKYKKLLLAAVLSAGLTSGAFASGIPTVDAAAIAQMVQQLTQLQQMYSQLQAQYNTAVSQLNAITGNRGLGMIHYDSKLRNLIPLDAQLRLNAIVRGTGSLSSLGKEVFDRLNLGQACENYTGEVKENCLKSQSFVAEQQAILEETQKTVTQRLEKVELLMQQINSATDAKAIADLSARIQAEQVALSSSKLAAEFQQAQMNQQAEIVKEQARQEAMKQIFPELTQEDVKNALKPIKVR
ncbi:type IV secretion system protein [Parasutterella muris]|uniref:type IV secretion system protein n=1 Tax=Parasutterella muris TaxID=2565572 RepID=UPI00203D8305|nr:type IV secretion system protein [Parasutterella muris]